MKLPPSRARQLAFTLIEVMIAIAIFFMAMFTILGVLSSGLRAASLLSTNGPTAGMVAAEASLTNKFEEGTESGNFGKIYPGWNWRREKREIATNGLFQMDIEVLKPTGEVDSTMTVLFYKPDSDQHLGLR